jgi:aspartyl-tRNA(Asn)/glutamyl-tRNA(Gln) amidotransferase subunit C
MKISREEVRHVALLARLALGPQEEEAFTEQLNEILTYMEKLNELNTDAIEPTVHAVEVPPPFRGDQVRNQADVDALMRNAPERDSTFFKVPKIIE